MSGGGAAGGYGSLQASRTSTPPLAGSGGDSGKQQPQTFLRNFGSSRAGLSHLDLSSPSHGAHLQPSPPQSSAAQLRDAIVEYFAIEERGSDIASEIRAGTSSFLTMAYILLVNPLVLGEPHTDIPRGDVLVGTAAGSALGCFVAGIGGNLPFALAPGLGLSAYMSFGLIRNQAPDSLDWQGALTCSFVAGLLMVALAVTRLSDRIMHLIPTSVKVATIVGMGMLLSFIAMQAVGIVIGTPHGGDGLVQLGDLSAKPAATALVGLLLVTTLVHHRVRGGALLSIVIMTVFSWASQNKWPTHSLELPAVTKALAVPLHVLAAAPIGSSLPAVASTLAIATFLFVGVFDVSGVVYGLARVAGLLHYEDDQGARFLAPPRSSVSVAESELSLAGDGGGPGKGLTSHHEHSGTSNNNNNNNNNNTYQHRQAHAREGEEVVLLGDFVDMGDEFDPTADQIIVSGPGGRRREVVPGSTWVFVGCGVGTCLAAMLGCSPVIVHVESAAGINEGGRTGLAAVTTGMWFTLSLFLSPLVDTVPPEATAPVVILVGAMMMGESSAIHWKDIDQALPAFLTLSLMPFSFNISNGILFGLVASAALDITTGNFFMRWCPSVFVECCAALFCFLRDRGRRRERVALATEGGAGQGRSLGGGDRYDPVSADGDTRWLVDDKPPGADMVVSGGNVGGLRNATSEADEEYVL